MTAMRHVGRSFAPVIKRQTAGGRAPCSFPPRFSRRSREEKRGGNRRKHGWTADCGLLLMEGVKLPMLFSFKTGHHSLQNVGSKVLYISF